MKRLPVVLLLVGALLLVVTSTAFAKGNGLSQAKVEERGWACFPPPPGLIVHCSPPNTDIAALFAGDLASVTSLNFDVTGETFLGTEVLIRADLFHGQPCPQGTFPGGEYEPVDFDGDGVPEYFSCHHFNELP